MKGFSRNSTPESSRTRLRNLVARISGDVENAQIGATAAQLFRELAPVETGHDEIGDEQMHRPFFPRGHFQSFSTTTGDDRSVASSSERPERHLADVRVIFDNQHCLRTA